MRVRCVLLYDVNLVVRNFSPFDVVVALDYRRFDVHRILAIVVCDVDVQSSAQLSQSQWWRL